MKRLICVILLAICCVVFSLTAFAESVTYTTEGCSWSKLNETTWVADTDGDGSADITLVKQGSEWTYYFNVPDPDAKYYAWEESVPESYTVVGQGTRDNPVYMPDPVSISKTSNVDDNGNKTGVYDNNLNSTEVVTIDGAKSLSVVITYQTQGLSYDWVCVWSGAHADYNPTNNYSSSLSGKLYGQTVTTKTYMIEGDSVTFGFKSNASTNNYLGYYAVVTGIGVETDDILSITNKSTEEPVKKGNLLLKKSVVGDDSIRNFGFDIELSTTDSKLTKFVTGSQTYGDVLFQDGKATVYLKDKEEILLKDISEGIKYKITEHALEEYVVTWSDGSEGSSFSGVIQGDVESVLTCINTKEPDETEELPKTSLKVMKQGDVSGIFDFKIVFWNLGKDVDYGAFTSDSSGMADYDFKLKSGESFVVNDLPVGCQFQVVELENSYKVSYEISGLDFVNSESDFNTSVNKELSTSKETIRDGDSPVVVFTNQPDVIVEPDTVNIKVNKVWNDNDNNFGLRPEFITVYLLENEEVVGSIKLDEQSEWKAEFTNLPKFREDGVTECEYRISELQVPGYQSTVNFKNGEYEIANTIQDVGSLYVSKTLQDADRIEASDDYKYGLDLEFQFVIKLTKDGVPVTGIYGLDSRTGTQSGTVVFDKDGICEIGLKHGESVCITNLPVGTEYEITETSYEDFKPVGSSSVTGVLVRDEVAEVEFVNKIDDSIPLPLPDTGGSGIIGLVICGVVRNSSGGALDYLTFSKWHLGSETGDVVTVDDVGKLSISLTEDIILVASYDELKRYAVCVWDICVDVDSSGKTMGLTFGPALGDDYRNSYLDHDPIGVTASGNAHRCLHHDSWQTVVDWNRVDPYVYEQCVDIGCTKAVPLDYHNVDFVASNYLSLYTYTGDGPSLVQDELSASSYGALYWNGTASGAGGWGSSRRRAVMNGADSLTNGTVANGSGLLDVSVFTDDNCLLSCFPDVLRDNIGEKAVKYKSAGVKISYDKLWSPSVNEVCRSVEGVYNFPDEGTVYRRWFGVGDLVPNVEGSASVLAGTTCTGNNIRWDFRSVYDAYAIGVWNLYGSGGFMIAMGTVGTVSSLSPCFTLSR